MLNTIERLREKPGAYRKRIAFIIAASIAGVIFLVWLSVLGVKLSNNEKEISEDKSSSLFAEVKRGFSGVLETGKVRFDEVKKGIESVSEQ